MDFELWGARRIDGEWPYDGKREREREREMLLRGLWAVGREANRWRETERERAGRCLGYKVFFSRQERKLSKGFSGLQKFWRALGPAEYPARIGLEFGQPFRLHRLIASEE